MGPGRGFEAALLVLFGAALAFQLLVPPTVGLANNGDFSRVAEPLGISPPEASREELYYNWVVPRYRFDPERIWLRGLCCYSSQTIFGILGLPVGLLISPRGWFDIEAMGIVNALGLVAALWVWVLALRPLRPALRIFGGVLLLLIFTDVAYVAYLNSFYTEPSTLIFFLAAIGLALLAARRSDRPLWLLPGFFLAAVLLATSRPQNAFLGPLFALLSIRLFGKDRDRSRRTLVAVGAAAVIVLSLWYQRQTPGPLREVLLYNAVFQELLPNSPDPRQDLVELGLPPELNRFAGTYGFSPAAPIADPGFRTVFFGRVTQATIVKFYAARPLRVAGSVERTARSGFQMRPEKLGNYDRASGKPARAQSRTFAFWSTAKETLAPARLWFVIAFLLVNVIGALAVHGRRRSHALRLAGEVWIAVVLVAAFQLAITALGSGAVTTRHLFLFNAAFDLLFAALCVWAAGGLLSRRKPRTA